MVLQQVQNAQQLAAQLNGQSNLLANAASLLPSLQGLGNLAGTAASAPTNQEEISTIFVVGFPDDMQVRLFTPIWVRVSDKRSITGTRVPEYVHVLPWV